MSPALAFTIISASSFSIASPSFAVSVVGAVCFDPPQDAMKRLTHSRDPRPTVFPVQAFMYFRLFIQSDAVICFRWSPPLKQAFGSIQLDQTYGPGKLRHLPCACC